MSVFCIGNIDIRDFEKYRNSGYLENAARTIIEYGGRYRVRGGTDKNHRRSACASSTRVHRISFHGNIRKLVFLRCLCPLKKNQTGTF